MNAILQVKGVTKRYGGLTANNDITFDVAPQEILSVIGPNGAGKSTLFKQIAGFVTPTTGEVIYKGTKISGLPPHKVARMGVVRTFQETTIFKSMTVRENVIVSHHLRSKASLLGFFFGTAQAKADEAEFGKSADDIIDFLGLQAIRNETASNLPQGHLRALGMAIGLATHPEVTRTDKQGIEQTLDSILTRFPRLKERFHQQASTLSGGEQQMMVIGRALMAKPKLLLLDEPSLGIAPKLVQDIARAIVAISRDEGVSVLLVEQNSRMALSISNRAYAM